MKSGNIAEHEERPVQREAVYQGVGFARNLMFFHFPH